MEIEKGALYVVGTPIGNLADLSPRGVEILERVDFIAAEDTRVSGKLLKHFHIEKPLISYFEHNIRQKGELICQRLTGGESCAVISDAGMPCISDPGEDLVRLCREKQIPVYVVPGPSAAVSALAVSGLSTSRFAFEGFLTTNKNGRKQHLQQIKDDTRTLIFYEAPHKLIQTLQDMYEVLGQRKIALARELTKIYEEVILTTLEESTHLYSEENKPKGEFVLVVEGASHSQESLSLEQAVEMARELMAGGQSASESAKAAAKASGLKKGDIYRLLSEK